MVFCQIITFADLINLLLIAAQRLRQATTGPRPTATLLRGRTQRRSTPKTSSGGNLRPNTPWRYQRSIRPASATSAS